MQVVVLAAGDGGRLLPLTAERPKTLLPVAGRPLIDHIVDALVLGGASRFLVVIGHHGEQLRAHLGRRADAQFRFVWNPDPESGNLHSLLLAAPDLPPEPFLLCMADHLLSEDIATRALAGYGDDANYVFVDSGPTDDPDATRVRLGEQGEVLAIDKRLASWDAVDTGLFRLRRDVLEQLAHLPPSADLNDGWRTLDGEARLRAIDIGGAWWMDIDTAADLARAEEALRRANRHGVRRARLARS